ncbi:hypothetical protein E5676_scaffold169G00120 [Cucumis melo var. makuwa]|uniref:Uncharacterized protein n=1 Tax=Cucumis melo var. makuwa TaxID=1194695 RepID=A0A5A7T6W6_CUCMM|nr:hypothetical protein E6C27_scaffold64G00120 [Cucumis melo var. makuwa]TYK00412.1 hypothetical protein E5676_scaffold169G00120 [Cucumis melo var. makuwa]
MMKKLAFKDLNCSFIFLVAQPSKLVGNYNIKLSCPLNNLFPFLETSWAISAQQVVTGLLVGAVTNIWHQCATFKLSSNFGINTLWSSPVSVDGDLSITLRSLELLGPLLHNLLRQQRHCHFRLYRY